MGLSEAARRWGSPFTPIKSLQALLHAIMTSISFAKRNRARACVHVLMLLVASAYKKIQPRGLEAALSFVPRAAAMLIVLLAPDWF